MEGEMGSGDCWVQSVKCGVYSVECKMENVCGEPKF